MSKSYKSSHIIIGILIVMIIVLMLLLKNCSGTNFNSERLKNCESLEQQLADCIDEKEELSRNNRKFANSVQSVLQHAPESWKYETLILNTQNASPKQVLDIAHKFLTSLGNQRKSLDQLGSFMDENNLQDFNGEIGELQANVRNKERQIQLMIQKIEGLSETDRVSPINLIEDASVFDSDFIELAEKTENVINDFAKESGMYRSQIQQLRSDLVRANEIADSLTITNDGLREALLEEQNARKAESKLRVQEKEEYDAEIKKSNEALAKARTESDEVICKRVDHYLKLARNKKRKFGCSGKLKLYYTTALELSRKIKKKENCINTPDSIRDEFPKCVKTMRRHPNEK